MPNHLTYQQIEKIGNTLVYLAKNVGELSKTKVLKLLFLIEESSIKKFGVPFFGVPFELWKYGPVIKDVMVDLSQPKPELFGKYVQKDPADDKMFVAVADFNDDEFSDNDIYVIEKIRDFARHKIAKDLVDFTHKENSLWRKSAIKYNVLDELEKGTLSTTNYTIDFSMLFDEGEPMQGYLKENLENREFINSLK